MKSKIQQTLKLRLVTKAPKIIRHKKEYTRKIKHKKEVDTE